MSWEHVALASKCSLETSGCTISPRDLLYDANSVPASTAFTDLTTPASAMLDTPDNESYQTSPLFDDCLQLDDCASHDWFNLFPVDSNDYSTTMTTCSSAQGRVVIHPGGESRRLKRVVVKASPITATTRPSSVAGVTKYEKVLPPIVVDQKDVVGLKRARNTAAARKSRDRKQKAVESMEERIRELEQQVEHWKSIALSTALSSSPDV